jgi:hypothetical protein
MRSADIFIDRTGVSAGPLGEAPDMTPQGSHTALFLPKPRSVRDGSNLAPRGLPVRPRGQPRPVDIYRSTSRNLDIHCVGKLCGRVSIAMVLNRWRWVAAWGGNKDMDTPRKYNRNVLQTS